MVGRSAPVSVAGEQGPPHSEAVGGEGEISRRGREWDCKDVPSRRMEMKEKKRREDEPRQETLHVRPHVECARDHELGVLPRACRNERKKEKKERLFIHPRPIASFPQPWSLPPRFASTLISFIHQPVLHPPSSSHSTPPEDSPIENWTSQHPPVPPSVFGPAHLNLNRPAPHLLSLHR